MLISPCYSLFTSTSIFLLINSPEIILLKFRVNVHFYVSMYVYVL